jgi:hypothetical protein
VYFTVGSRALQAAGRRLMDQDARVWQGTLRQLLATLPLHDHDTLVFLGDDLNAISGTVI